MRRIYFFFAVLFLPIVSLAQNKYAAEALGFSEPMVIQKRVEKPGMTAEQIYNTFIHPKRGSDVRSLGSCYGTHFFNGYEIIFDRKIFFDVDRQVVSFDYYLHPQDGFYIVSLTDILIQGRGRALYVSGINGIPYKREYSKGEYKRVLKIIDFANVEFEKFSNEVEEKAFPVLTPAD